MNDINRKLFKSALIDAFVKKIDDELEISDEDASYSASHNRKMRQITRLNTVGNKNKRKTRSWILILAAALLLLAGCTAYVYRNEIRNYIEKIYDDHIHLTYDDGRSDGKDNIENVYTLTYVPSGFELLDEIIESDVVLYDFTNDTGDLLRFEQRLIDGLDILLDVGEAIIIEYDEYQIYHIHTGSTDVFDLYIWNDGKYVLCLEASVVLTEDELERIIDGISIE